MFFGWRGRLFFKYYSYYEFCFFRVACAVIFNYYYYHEFCFSGGAHIFYFLLLPRLLFFGWRARFLIITTIANFVFRLACTVIYLINTTRTCFRVACTAILNYHYYHEFYVFGWCARLFLIITTIACFVFFGWCAGLLFLKSYYYRELLFVRVVCAVIFNYYYDEEFCFFWWCARFFFHHYD